MKLIIGSDIAFSDSEKEAILCGKTKNIISDDLKVYLESGIFIANLETPLTDTGYRSEKFGRHITAPYSFAKTVKETGAAAVSLANNHMMDAGDDGLYDTVKALSENGIKSFGYYTQNGSHATFCTDDVTVYAFCDTEYTKGVTCGAETYDEFLSLDKIEELKKNGKKLAVLYHGGREYYKYPTPRLAKLCRRICDKGADLVVCQHSHCVGAMEEYNGSTIVYGQGNFRFANSKDALGGSILIEYDGNDINIVPIINGENETRLAKGGQADEILNELKIRSEDIKKEGFIEQNFSKYVISEKDKYLRMLKGSGRITSKLYKLTGKRIYDRKNALRAQNIIECSAHSEILKEAICEYIKEDNR